MIEIDIEKRLLQIVGTKVEIKTHSEINKILSKRKENWVPKEAKYKTAVSPMKGGYME